MRHFLSIHDLTQDELKTLLTRAGKLKQETRTGVAHPLLKGKTLGMIFSKSSTRTRVSFEVGMYQLGGYPLFLSSSDIQLGRGETIYDTAKVLSRYISGIMIRTFSHADVVELARYSSVPVINGLTDLLHPCQALADIMTIYEYKKRLEGIKLAYVGDGNNVAHSLLYAGAKTGMTIAVATPKGYECDGKIVENACDDAAKTGAKVIITNDPTEAADSADIIYTDTWVSMGQEVDKQDKVAKFQGYQVDNKMMSHANDDCLYMHCLPQYRGYEVSEDVADGPRSVIFDQAENRLHAQKAVMVMLMGGM